jgi:twitching motility protein PilT
MARLDTFLRLIAEQGASDLHFHAGNVPLIRHDGDLIPLPFRQLSELETSRFLLEILSEEQRAELAKEQELDLVYELPGVARFRANFFVQSHGLGAVFRAITGTIPTLDELGMPPIVRKLTQLQNGLVLVTGPTGSGKSTTLAAMIDEINRTSARHVISIEDPVEYVHTSRSGVVTQRQVGKHAESFANALRSALRESPDVLIVGEMRDPETIQLAVAAAETGVLVIGTLHTNSAAKAVDRILDVVSEEARDQVRSTLSVLLRGVLSQHLVKRADGDGRAAALEILLLNYAVANLIRENKVFQIDAYLDTASNDGTGAQSLDACLFRMIRDGHIVLEEALKVANQPDSLKRLVNAISDED